jgi:hypothetical protein
MDYGLYGLGSKSAHLAQIDLASLFNTTVLVTKRSPGISSSTDFR